jgi:hypothetical protein
MNVWQSWWLRYFRVRIVGASPFEAFLQALLDAKRYGWRIKDGGYG